MRRNWKKIVSAGLALSLIVSAGNAGAIRSAAQEMEEQKNVIRSVEDVEGDTANSDLVVSDRDRVVTVSGSAVTGTAVSGSGVSSGSAVEATQTPQPEVTPGEEISRPAAPVIQARGGSKRVRLTWSKVTGADGYYVYCRKSADGVYERVKTITDGSTTTYTKKSLDQNAQYKFCMTAYRTTGSETLESEFSGVVSAETKTVSDTSKKAEKYATKAAFQKSPAYKTYKKMQSYMNYSKCFAIPGMVNTNVAGFGNKNMVPQGMCLAGSYFLITAYDYKNVDYSVIYVVSRASKSYITTIVLPSKAKVGGIAYDGKNIWISKGSSVASFPYSVVTDAVNAGSSYTELSSYKTVQEVSGTAAYIGYYNGVLWVGSFQTSTSQMIGYVVGGADTPELTAKYTMAAPAKTQGITFTSDGTMLLTRAYRTNKSKSGYISQIRSYKPSYEEVGTSGSIKKNTAKAVTTLPPMAEGVAVYGSYTYTLFSSTYYKSCKYPVDRVIAMKTSKLV